MSSHNRPINFSIKSSDILDRYGMDFLPFAGLELNDNPLTTTANSCADVLNMTVDDDAFLTLRPRIIYDENYELAKEACIRAQDEMQDYTTIVDIVRVKDGYLFLNADNTQYKALFYVLDGHTTGNWILNSTAVQDIGAFNDFYSFVEKDYAVFVRKNTGKRYKLTLNQTYTFNYAEEYVPVYKAGISEVSGIKTAPIVEDLNILSDKFKVSVAFGDGIVSPQPNLDFFANGAVDVNGVAYTISTIEQEPDSTDISVCHHDSLGVIYYKKSEYSSAMAITTGSTLLNFYYYDFTAKTKTVVFTIKVYAVNSLYSDGISKSNLLNLSVGRDNSVNYETKDGNGKYIGGLYYDTATASFVRLSLDNDQEQDYTRHVWLYTYNVATKTFVAKTIAKYKETDFEGGVLIVRYFYNSSVAFVSLESFLSVALIMHTISSDETYNLIGKVNDNEYLIPATDPYGKGYLGSFAISNIALYNQQVFIIANHDLDYLTTQTLASGTATELTPILDWSEDYLDHIRTSIYYNVGSTISVADGNFFDISSVVNGYRAVNTNCVLSGKELLLYSDFTYNNPQYRLVRIPLETIASTNAINISSLFSSKFSYNNVKAIGITSWGAVQMLIADDTKLNLIKIDYDSTLSYGFLRYVSYNVSPIGDLSSVSHFYHTDDGFNLSILNSLFSIIKIEASIIEYTYLISNNATNPVKIDADVLENYNEYRNAFLNVRSTLFSSARLYYNDVYYFATMPDNYDYIPIIYCNKAKQTIRFASSYLQEVGVIYERNNIEYITFTDNPYVDTQYQGHSSVLILNSVEQRAIDYLPNGNLITFAGATVYLNNGGLFILNFNANTPQDTERKASLVSQAVNKRLLKEDLTKAILVNSSPYVLIMFPGAENTKIYAYKILSGYWFYWEIPFVVSGTVDDNTSLRLFNSNNEYIKFTEDPIKVNVSSAQVVYVGNVETYLDFNLKTIPWFWKSQPLSFGSVTKRKQVLESYFTFVNNNANYTVNDTTLNIDQNKIAQQQFGIVFYAYKDVISETPHVEFEGTINIINNIHRRTYLNRFKYCQLMCYNIDNDNAPADKVRLANIIIMYRYLSGGK